MKVMYKIILFFTVFYMVVLMINALNIFPMTLYDTDTESDLQKIENKGFEQVAITLFVPKHFDGLEGVSVYLLIGFVVAFAAGTGILTHSAVMPAVVIVGYVFFVMFTRSYEFFSKIFNNPTWTNDSMVYLGICIGAGIVVIAMITVVEMVAQGRSGE